MTREKQQGTAFETWAVTQLNEWTDGWAERVAEGGSNDAGDVRFVDELDDVWMIECKATERLNVTRALAKAKRKSGVANTVLAWKRLVKSAGARRTPDGEPIVVVMDWSTYLGLMGAHPDD